MAQSRHNGPLCWVWLEIIVWLCVSAGCRPESSARPLVFLVLPRTLSNDFHSSLVAGAKSTARDLQVTLQIYAPTNEDDYLLQEHYLQEVATHKSVRGVVLTPNHSAKLLPALRQLDRQGIPFVIVDTPMELPNEPVFLHYCGFIGTDNRHGGSLAAEHIGKTIGQGNVLLIRGIMSHHTSQDREDGFLTAIKRYPRLQIVHVVEGNWNQEGVKAALKTLSRTQLASIDAVFAYNDLMALGAADYFHHYQLRPYIVGYDGLLEAQSAIIAGRMDATVTQAPETMGKRAVARLRQCIEQQSYSGETELTHVTLLMATRTLTAVSSYETE